MASSSPLGHSVIPIVNKLQAIFARLGSSSTIELPLLWLVEIFYPEVLIFVQEDHLFYNCCRLNINLMMEMMKSMESSCTCLRRNSLISLIFAERFRNAETLEKK